jgi:NADPH:quinone reductase-like Zn-dependent oxidoreductase
MRASPGGGCAEYLEASAPMCVPLSELVDMEQGATPLVNSLTPSALTEEAQLGQLRQRVNLFSAPHHTANGNRTSCV